MQTNAIDFVNAFLNTPKRQIYICLKTEYTVYGWFCLMKSGR